VDGSGRQHRTSRYRKIGQDPARSETLCMHPSTSCGNREVPRPIGSGTPIRIGNSEEYASMTDCGRIACRVSLRIVPSRRDPCPVPSVRARQRVSLFPLIFPDHPYRCQAHSPSSLAHDRLGDVLANLVHLEDVRVPVEPADRGGAAAPVAAVELAVDPCHLFSRVVPLAQLVG
jgi:hypothetical protein